MALWSHCGASQGIGILLKASRVHWNSPAWSCTWCMLSLVPAGACLCSPFLGKKSGHNGLITSLLIHCLAVRSQEATPTTTVSNRRACLNTFWWQISLLAPLYLSCCHFHFPLLWFPYYLFKLLILLCVFLQVISYPFWKRFYFNK